MTDFISNLDDFFVLLRSPFGFACGGGSEELVILAEFMV